jgi:hypothetical protein
MCEFIILNKNKLKFAAFVSWLLFGFLNSIIVVFYLSDDKSITFWRGILLTALYATISTFILLAVAISFGGYEFNRKKRVFGLPEWNGVFAKHNFETIRIYQHSRWLLTEEVKTGYIKGFPVLADIKRDRAGFVQFMYFIEPASIDKQRFKQLRQLLKKPNGSLEVGYVCKKIKRNLKHSEEEIDKELEDFADILMREGFIPKASGR